MLEHILHYHRGFNSILKLLFYCSVLKLLPYSFCILRKTCIFMLLLYDNITLASHLVIELQFLAVTNIVS